MIEGKRILILVFLLCTACWATAQKTKAQLQKEKQQNQQKIKEVEKILSETTTKKKNSLGELTALNQRIHQQENLIGSIKSEITLLDNDIDENNEFIGALEEDLKKLKKEYAAMAFAAQKANNSATRLTFLFSADSFEQLIMRMRYMKQYAEKRKVQAAAITAVQQELSGQIKQIEIKKSEKNTLLNEELKENTNLSDLKKKQNLLVKSLEKQEKSLKRDLDESKKAIAKLDKLINDIIREEMERAARAAKSTPNSKSSLVAMSATFEENKKKFPWPVEGFITIGFGRQKHPLLRGVYIDNDGVNIQTSESEKVKSIFQGEVRKIALIAPLGNTVIIQHGEYFTVYSGLRDVVVKIGEKVSTGQEVGHVLTNGQGVSELRFQIHKNTTALDPRLWLRN